MNQTRYPGAKPFTADQRDIFFGRKQDTIDLYRLIRQEKLTVLYAKSGLGKSSLLNAGIIPKAKTEGRFYPIPIRFLSYKSDQNHSSPIKTTVERVKIHQSSTTTFLDRLIKDEGSLWHHLKEQQILDADENEGLLLIFDQFEELFTYPPEQQLAFRKQIAEAINTPLPQRYWDMLDLYTPEEMPFSSDELALLQKPFNIRIVFSIRQDRVHLLGGLSDYLPTISKNWFKLDALDESSATDAIIEPASSEGDFLTPPFSYTDEALKEILFFLTDEGKHKVEGTQLQIVCNSIEQKVKNQQLKVVDYETIGNLESVIENYYDEKIKTISDPIQQLSARRLVEEGLIFEEEERRLSLYEGQVMKSFAIESATLQALVDGHLLRAEPSMKGGYTYELSHDSLVAPVLKAKDKRVTLEKQAEAEQLRAEQQAALEAAKAEAERERQRAREQEKLRTIAEENEKKARKRTQLAVFISLLALALSAFAGAQFMNAKQARAKAEENLSLAMQKEKEALASAQKALTEQERAEEEKRKAMTATELANYNAELAQENKKTAEANALKAEQQKLRALESAAQAKLAKQEADKNLEMATKKEKEAEISAAAAESEKKNAEEAALREREANKETVLLQLKEIDADILKLQYDKAFDKLKIAIALKAEQTESNKRLQEVAFVWAECKAYSKAQNVLSLIDLKVNNSSQSQFRTTIKKINPSHYNKLEKRYYPEMIKVIGGEFKMGSKEKSNEQPVHKEKVNSFRMAKTETTVWQYYLYVIATKAIMPETPTWGWVGNNPIRKVSWFDAVAYSNWLSSQRAKSKVYLVDTNVRTPNKLAAANINWKTKTDFSANGYRLPTEVEWEYAARGGQKKSSGQFSGSDKLTTVGWYKANANGRSHSVGSKKANGLGLYDMSGNAWEWCWDWYTEKYNNNKNTNMRVVRGGSWNLGADYSRVAYRGSSKPDILSSSYGFRCVASE